VLSGQNGHDLYPDPDGVHVLGVYRWLPENKLGLLVEIEEAELTRQIWRVWTLTILLSIALLAVTALTARYLTHWLVRPLEQVTQAVSALRSGSMNHRVSVKGPDEFEQLARTFNDMADSLQRSYEMLHSELDKEKKSASLSPGLFQWLPTNSHPVSRHPDFIRPAQ